MSPDGKLIAFLQQPYETFSYYGPADLWVMDANGRNLRRLGPSRADAHCPSWSPDSRRLAVSIRGYIEVIEVRTGKRRRLTTTSVAYDSCPAWSPNGRQIVFERHPPLLVPPDLWVISARGGQPKQLTATKGGEFQPTWSPNGRQVAFTRAFELWTLSLDTATETLVLADTEMECPDWSPDGQAFVYSSAPDPDFLFAPETAYDAESEIFTVSIDGHDTRQLTHERGSHCPSWDPTGRRIVFARSLDILSISSNGTRPHVLGSPPSG
jgi:TolB protein